MFSSFPLLDTLRDRLTSLPIAAELSAFRDRLNRRPPSRAQRIAIYEFLADLLANGVSIVDALTDLQKIESNGGKDPNRNTALLATDWIATARLRSLADALGSSIPAEERMIIDAGESSQRLIPMLLRLKRFLEQEAAARGLALLKLGYPLIVVAATFVLSIFARFTSLDKLAAIFPFETWTPLAKSFWYVSTAATYTAAPILIGIIAAIVGYIWACPRWVSELRTRLDRLPPFALYRDRMAARSLATLAALKHAATLNDRDALDRLAPLASPWLRHRLASARYYVAEGFNLGDAFRLANLNFPDERSILEITRYATLDSFADKLDRLADASQVRAAKNLDRFTNRVTIGANIWIVAFTFYLLFAVFSLALNLGGGPPPAP